MMRIISGKYKGRLIKMPEGIRPTQDKVRKALFDILGDIEGLSFLELFAGSGAVGLEAVSRGAADLTLVEYNSHCLFVIKKNIESFKLGSCNLYSMEAQEAIKKLYKDKRKFDIIFLDPPYYPKSTRLKDYFLDSYDTKLSPLRSEPSPKYSICRSYRDNREFLDIGLAKKTLQILEAYDILAPNGFIVVQHFKKDILPDAIGKLMRFRQAKYSDTILSFYRKKVS